MHSTECRGCTPCGRTVAKRGVKSWAREILGQLPANGIGSGFCSIAEPISNVIGILRECRNREMGDGHPELTPNRLFWKSIAPAKTVRIPQNAVPVSRLASIDFQWGCSRSRPLEPEYRTIGWSGCYTVSRQCFCGADSWMVLL